MEIKVIPRKWGSSIAVIIPKEIVEKEKIKENVPILAKFNKERPRAGVLFGKFPKWRLTTEEMKDDVRRGWLSASDREREKEWERNQERK